MSLTWGQVKTWSSTDLSGYAGKVGARRDAVMKQADALQQSMTSFQGEGQTADALREKMTVAHKELTTLADDLAEVQDAVTAAVGNISDVESAVQEALSCAKRKNCTISDSGRVTCLMSGGAYTYNERNSAEKSVIIYLQRALELADYADASLRARLSSVGTEGSMSSASGKGAHSWSKAEQEKFQSMSPEERAKFWSEQTYEQKQYLADHYPQLIGNADGVEAWARDRANRINLQEKKLKAERQIEWLKAAERDPAAISSRTELRNRRERAERDLEDYKKIESALANGISLEDYQHGKQGEPVSLLTLQDDGVRVKAAVAQGDIDNAKHIATHVPGVGTTVEGGLDTYMRKTGNLRRAAAQEGQIPIQDVATVAWLGYDAPGGDDYVGMARPILAEEGSKRLAGFLTGIHESRRYGAGDAHMTLVGHSYGSTTSGMAATKVKPGVIDDMILYASPGMGTYSSKNFHVDQHHLWVSAVPNGDSIQGLGFFTGLGEDPAVLNSGFTHLSGDARGYSGYDRFATRNYKLPFQTSNHAVYLEEGTETLRDFGRVVSGVKYREVMKASS